MMKERNIEHRMEIGDEGEQMMVELKRSNQASTSIKDVQAMASLIRGKLCHKSPTPSKCSIFKVPDRLRRHNQKAFEPEIVSIGPFHHGKEKLQAMEKIKLWYLHCLLNRAPTGETVLECFIEAVGSVVQECRACYAGDIDDFVETEFIEMMVVDGCFIIEFFRKVSMEVQRDEEDPVFNTSLMTWQIIKDLLMLENQLPWRVLDCLFNLTKSNVQHRSLPNLIVSSIFGYEWSSRDDLKHILDCIRYFLIDQTRNRTCDTAVKSYTEQIPSVTELVQAGVKFKVGDRRNQLNVTFRNGVMTIPQKLIFAETEPCFRNLIAFEQCDPSRDFKITSYAKFLDDLINTSQDVDFLKHQRILKVYLNNEDVTSIFNRLYCDADVGSFLYSDLYREVNAHFRRPWNRWRATLRHDYFNNPWTSLSVVATVVIIVFTFLPTIYSILSYYRPTV